LSHEIESGALRSFGRPCRNRMGAFQRSFLDNGQLEIDNDLHDKITKVSLF
jgi:hypothetical protein